MIPEVDDVPDLACSKEDCCQVRRADAIGIKALHVTRWHVGHHHRVQSRIQTGKAVGPVDVGHRRSQFGAKFVQQQHRDPRQPDLVEVLKAITVHVDPDTVTHRAGQLGKPEVDIVLGLTRSHRDERRKRTVHTVEIVGWRETHRSPDNDVVIARRDAGKRVIPIEVGHRWRETRHLNSKLVQKADRDAGQSRFARFRNAVRVVIIPDPVTDERRDDRLLVVVKHRDGGSQLRADLQKVIGRPDAKPGSNGLHIQRVAAQPLVRSIRRKDGVDLIARHRPPRIGHTRRTAIVRKPVIGRQVVRELHELDHRDQRCPKGILHHRVHLRSRDDPGGSHRIKVLDTGDASRRSHNLETDRDQCSEPGVELRKRHRVRPVRELDGRGITLGHEGGTRLPGPYAQQQEQHHHRCLQTGPPTRQEPPDGHALGLHVLVLAMLNAPGFHREITSIRDFPPATAWTLPEPPDHAQPATPGHSKPGTTAHGRAASLTVRHLSLRSRGARETRRAASPPTSPAAAVAPLHTASALFPSGGALWWPPERPISRGG